MGIFDRYTDEAKRAIFFARHEACEAGSSEITLWHLLLGMLHDDGTRFERLFTLRRFDKPLRDILIHPAKSKSAPAPPYKDIPLSKECKMTLAYAAEEDTSLGGGWIGSEHLLLGILRLEKQPATNYLQTNGVSLESARSTIRANPDERPYLGPIEGKILRINPWLLGLAVLIAFTAGYEFCFIFHLM